MSLPIKVGFVGLSSTGWAATTLGPSLLQPALLTKYDLVAVSTTSEASAKASAEKHSALTGHAIKAYHGDSFQIAADPDIDLVVVSVKPQRQRNAVLPVIEQNKNFFLEWPVGGAREVYEIAEAAREHGVRSMIGLQARCSPVVRKVKDLIETGAIGAVRSSVFIGLAPRTTFWPPYIGEEYAPLVLNKANGAYPLRVAIGPQLDPFLFTLGDFRTVNATSTTVYPTATIIDSNGKPTGEILPAAVPDHYTISGQLRSGAIATIIWRLGYKTTPGRRQLLWEIDGEDGSIRIESDTTAYLNLVSPTVFLNGEKIDVEDVGTGTLGILRAAWDSYADGEEEKYATIEDAVRVHRILDAVEQSLDAGKTIVL